MTDDLDIGGMLTDQVGRLFERTVNRATWVAAEDGTFAAALWAELAEMGLPLALCGEEAGGASLSWAACEPVLRLSGFHAAPVPLGETMAAAWALDRCGIAVPDGVLALSEQIFTLGPDGRVTGKDPALPWAAEAGHAVLAARREGELHLCLVDTAAAVLRPGERGLSRLPQAEFVLDAAPAVTAAAPQLAELGLKPLLAALRSVQMAGLLASALTLAVEYANTRVQFGRPLARFQAIQHALAELAEQAAAAQVAGLFACRRIDGGDAAYGAAVAKTRLGQAATRGAAIAHQIFGAIGVTDEHSLHYYTRRLWQWRSEAGSDHWWADYLGRRALAAGGAAFWEKLTRPLTA